MTHPHRRRYRALFSPSLPLNLVLKKLRRMPGIAADRLRALERELQIREHHLHRAMQDLRQAQHSLRAIQALLRQAGGQVCPCDVLHITLEPAQHWLQRGMATMTTRH